MTVLASQDIFTFQRRAQDVRVDIATDAEPGDLSGITFRSVNGSIEKTGLTAESGGIGGRWSLRLCRKCMRWRMVG